MENSVGVGCTYDYKGFKNLTWTWFTWKNSLKIERKQIITSVGDRNLDDSSIDTTTEPLPPTNVDFPYKT